MRQLGFLSLFLASSCGVLGNGLDTLIWRNPLPTGNHLTSVVFHNGAFITVGELGTILTSPDGFAWTTRSGQSTNTLLSLAAGNGIAVAVGGQGAVLTSPDGVNWTQQPPPVPNDLLKVVFGAGRFVALSKSGPILSSEDGTNWATRYNGPRTGFEFIAHGHDGFIASGPLLDRLTLISPDGLTWTERSITIDVPSNFYQPFSLAAGNGLYVAGATRYDRFFNTPVFLVSTNGSNWFTRSPVGFYIPALVTFVNGNFIVNSNVGSLQFSPDTVTWSPTATTNLPVANLRSFAFGNNRYVGVGNTGTIVVSTNGTHWEKTSSGELRIVSGIAFGGGRYVAVGGLEPSVLDLGGTILTSSDGVSYSLAATTYETSAVTYGSNAFFAVGKGGNIIESSNGTSWILRASGTGHHLYDIEFHNNMLIAVGGGGTILTSSTGRGWTSRFSGTGYDLYDMTHGAGQYVVVGHFGVVVTSPNGKDWEVQFADTLNDFYGVTHGDGIYVAVGRNGTIMTSPDGVVWSAQTSGVTSHIRSVAYGDGLFVAVGELGPQFLISSNGVNWSKCPLPTYQHLYSVNYLNETFVLAGHNGTILQTAAEEILLTMQQGGRVLVRGGRPGEVLHLQRCINFGQDAWSDVLTFTNALPQVQLTDPAAHPRNSFYRISR